jgi:hypothetical protein
MKPSHAELFHDLGQFVPNTDQKVPAIMVHAMSEAAAPASRRTGRTRYR